jgi:hypothetical protein
MNDKIMSISEELLFRDDVDYLLNCLFLEGLFLILLF